MGIAALILFGLKKGVDGGGKFLSGLEATASDLAVGGMQNGMATATVTAGGVALVGGSDLLAGVMMMSAGEGNGGGEKTTTRSTKGGASSITPEKHVETKLAEIDRHRSLLFGRAKKATERNEMMGTLIQEIERNVREAKSPSDQALWQKAAAQVTDYLRRNQDYITDRLTLGQRASEIPLMRKKLDSLASTETKITLSDKFFDSNYDFITNVTDLHRCRSELKYVALYLDQTNTVLVSIFNAMENHSRMIPENVWLMGAGLLRAFPKKIIIDGRSQGFPTPPEYLTQIAEAMQRALEGDIRVEVSP